MTTEQVLLEKWRSLAPYNQRNNEAEFYQAYFQSVAHHMTDVGCILEMADQEATKFGLGAMDALHVAAAVLGRAEQFITSEKPTKLIHRTKSIQVIALSANQEEG